MVTPRRTALAALLAGGLVAVGLTVLNVLAGPQVCLSPLVCAPPLPGETGCGPVTTTCYGTLVPVRVAVALTAVTVAVVAVIPLVLRRAGARRARQPR